MLLHRRGATAAVLVSLWGLQLGAQQQTTAAGPSAALTLEDAIGQAEANEPTFAAALAERRATALERKDAIAGMLPSVVYHNEYLFTQSNKTQAVTTQGGVNESLPAFIANNAIHEYYSQGSVTETIGFSKVAALRTANANAARAAAELEVTRRGLIQTVVSMFYTASMADRKISIAQRGVDEASRFVEVTRERESAREAAHADVIKARLAQQQRERDLDDAQLTAERSRLELGVLLFPDPNTDYKLAADAAPPALPERADVEAAAKNNNPEIRSALARVQGSQAAVQAAKAALLPDLSLNFIYGIDAPQLATHGPDAARNLGYSAGATLDIPVWDWLTSERKIKEAEIQGQAVKAALSNTQRRLLAELTEFYDQAVVTRRQLASLDASVTDARESLRLTDLRYKNGEGTVLEVVDAQGTLISAEDAQVDGIVRYRVALAQLETLTGRL